MRPLAECRLPKRYSAGSGSGKIARARRLCGRALLAFSALICLQGCESFDTASGLQWSPDGRRLVMTRDTFDPSLLDGEDSPAAKPPPTAGEAAGHDGVWVFGGDGSPLGRVSERPGSVQWVGTGHLLVGSDYPSAESGPWDLVDLKGKRQAHIVPEAPEVVCWAVSPDGRYLAYVGEWDQDDSFRCSVVLYRLRDRCTVGRYDISLIGWTMAWSPDSRYVYGPAEDRGWRLDVVGGRLEEKTGLQFPSDPLGPADFAVNDGGQIVVPVDYHPTGGLDLIDWATGRQEQIAEGIFTGVAFGGDPNVFVCVKHTEEGQVRTVWLGRFRDGAWHLAELEGVEPAYAVMALSPDSKRLAYVAADGSVKVIDLPKQ